MFNQTSINVRLTYEESDDDVILGQGEINWQLHNIGDQMSFMSWPFDSDLSGDNTWFWMLTCRRRPLLRHAAHRDGVELREVVVCST